MTFQTFGRCVRHAAIALILGIGGLASASEPAPGPVVASPVVGPGAAPCPTCNGTAGSTTCQTCKHNPFGIGKKGTPYQTHLCPGACFGYFPTQWHRWDEVCPIPYPGAGLSDAPRIPTPALTGGQAPVIQTPKTPVDPKALPDPKTLIDPKNPKGDLPKPNPLPTIPNPGN